MNLEVLTKQERRPKVPLAWAIETLSSLCAQLEDGENPDDVFIQVFNESKLDVAEAIDRRKNLVYAIAGNLSAARAARADLDSYIQKLKGIESKVRENTKELMEAHPDLPYRDTAGRKLSLSNNAQPSLKLAFEIKGSRTFTNLVDDETIKMFDIEDRHLKTITCKILNTEVIKADLAEGKEIIWADLEYGKHVRGLLPKKNELES